MTEEEIWYRPNELSNSMGNIAIHLCGNLRQWVVAGLGGEADVRERQQEFDERGPIPIDQLMEMIQAIEEDTRAVIDRLDEAELLRIRPVQIYEESGTAILIHVVEHFSYHVGQLAYFVKAHRNEDVGFYEGQDL